MGPGTGSAWQHDVRWQPDRTLTIFDNGAGRRSTGNRERCASAIDWANRTVTLVSRYVGRSLRAARATPSPSPNGDTFVGWGEDAVCDRIRPRTARSCS